MSQEHSSNKIAITVAIVGAVATIVAALISTQPWKGQSIQNEKIITSNLLTQTIKPDTPGASINKVEEKKIIVESECFIKTGMMTILYIKPDPRSARMRELPNGEKYTVLDKQKDRWGNYFFKVKDKDTEGWVMNLQCEETSAKCFE